MANYHLQFFWSYFAIGFYRFSSQNFSQLGIIGDLEFGWLRIRIWKLKEKTQ